MESIKRLAAILLASVSLTACVGTTSQPRIEPVSFKPSETAPNVAVQVDSLKPTFVWKQAPGTVSAKTDFAIWYVSPNGTPGEMVYSREGIVGNQHTLEVPLAPGGEYFWSVKPSDSTVWATSDSSVTIPLGGVWQHGLPFKIRTPNPDANQVSTVPPGTDVTDVPTQSPLSLSTGGGQMAAANEGREPMPPALDIRELDAEPVCIQQRPPGYPIAMRVKGVSGLVVVDFIVDPEGRVRAAFAIRATRAEFAEPAVRAVSEWVFIPGKVRGKPVYTHMQVPIIFDLNH